MMESNSYKIKMPKPRNPLVEEAHFRRAGNHEKPHKAQRTKEKAKLLLASNNTRFMREEWNW